MSDINNLEPSQSTPYLPMNSSFAPGSTNNYTEYNNNTGYLNDEEGNINPPKITNHVSQVDPIILANILSYLPAQDIIKCQSISRQFLYLTQNPSLWTTLDLTTLSHKITDQWLIDFLSNPRNRHVTALNLATCSALTDAMLDRLPDLLPFLHTIDISYCTGFSPDAVVKLALLPHLQRLDFFLSFKPNEIAAIVQAILYYRRELYSPYNNDNNNENVPQENAFLGTSMYTNRFFPNENVTRFAISPDRHLNFCQKRELEGAVVDIHSSINNNNPGMNNSRDKSTPFPPQHRYYKPSQRLLIPQDYIDLGKTALQYCLIVNLNPLNLLNSNYLSSFSLLGTNFDPYVLHKEQLLQQNQQDGMDEPEVRGRRRRERRQRGDGEEGNNQDGDDEMEDEDDEDDDIDDDNPIGNNFVRIDENTFVTDRLRAPKWLQTFPPCCTAAMAGQCFGKIKHVSVYSYITGTESSQLVSSTHPTSLSTPNEKLVPPSLHSYGHWFCLSKDNGTNNNDGNNQLTTSSTNQETNDIPLIPKSSKKFKIYPHAPLRLTIAGIFAECSAHRGMTGTLENVSRCLHCEKFFLSHNLFQDGCCVGCLTSENYGSLVSHLAMALNRLERRNGAMGDADFLSFSQVHLNLSPAVVRNMTLVNRISFDLEQISPDNNDNDDNFNDMNGDGIEIQTIRNVSDDNVTTSSTPSSSSTTVNLLDIPSDPTPMVTKVESEAVIEDGRILYDPAGLFEYDFGDENDQDVLGLLGLDDNNFNSFVSTNHYTDPVPIETSQVQQDNSNTLNNTQMDQSQNQPSQEQQNQPSGSSQQQTTFPEFYQNLLSSQTHLKRLNRIVRKMYKQGYTRTIITTTPPFITHQALRCPDQQVNKAIEQRLINQSTDDNAPPKDSHEPPIPYFVPSLLDKNSQIESTNQVNRTSNTTLTTSNNINDVNNHNPNEIYVYGDCRGTVGPRAESMMYITDYTLRTSPHFWLFYLIVGVLVAILTQCFATFRSMGDSTFDNSLITTSPSYYLDLDGGAQFNQVVIYILVTFGVATLLTCGFIFCLLRFQEACLRIYQKMIPIHFGILMLSSNFSFFVLAALGFGIIIDWFTILGLVIFCTILQAYGLFATPSQSFNGLVLRQVTIATLSITCATSFVSAFPLLPFVITLIILAFLDLIAFSFSTVLVLDQVPFFLVGTAFPHLAFPVTNKTALRLGEFLFVGLAIGCCYRIHTTYGLISILLTLGVVGRSVMLQPYRVGFSSSLNHNDGGNINNHNLASNFLKPTIVLALWMFIVWIDSLVTYDLSQFDDILEDGFAGKTYITGVIPYFIEVISSPATQTYTQFFYPVLSD